MTENVKEQLLEMIRQTKSVIEKLPNIDQQSANITMLNVAIRQLENGTNQQKQEVAQ